MADLFTADPHWGHNEIRISCKRPFDSTEVMNRVMIERWNHRVKRTDTVFLAGDVFLKMSQGEALAIRSKLNGNINLILGNHDQIARSIPQAWGFVKESYLYHTKLGTRKIAIYLHHYAQRVWLGSHKGVWHLYGHSHGHLKEDPLSLSFDIGVDCWDYSPVGLDQVIERMEMKIKNRDWLSRHPRMEDLSGS